MTQSILTVLPMFTIISGTGLFYYLNIAVCNNFRDAALSRCPLLESNNNL